MLTQLLSWLAPLADPREEVVAGGGAEAAGQCNIRYRHLVEAVSLLASSAFEMHMVVGVRVLGAGGRGASSVMNDVGGADYAVDYSFLFEGAQGPVQRNPVGIGAQLLL